MVLALVLAKYESEFICDMVQYYHIIDYLGLSPVLVATLLVGLPDDSRVKMAISGSKLTIEQNLLARLVDSVNFLAWAQTTDAEKNRNRPKSILDVLLGNDTKHEKLASMKTKEEFHERWKEITGG